MTPAVDIREAAVLVDRARRLVEPHQVSIPGLRYFARSMPSDVRILAKIAQNARDKDKTAALRLFV